MTMGDVHVYYPYGIIDQGQTDQDDFFDDDYENYQEHQELNFKMSSIIGGSFSLYNDNGYYLIEVNCDGLLLEKSIRSVVMDLTKNGCLIIDGFDIDYWNG